MRALLDELLPEHQIRAHHRVSVPVDVDTLWQAAREVRPAHTAHLARVIRWRVPQADTELPYVDMFAAHPFALLHEDDHSSLSGLCGRIWTTEDDYCREVEDAAAFRAWSPSKNSRVLFAHWAQAHEDGARLYSEVRVCGTDRRSRLALKGLWALVGPFEGLVATEALKAARQRALDA